MAEASAAPPSESSTTANNVGDGEKAIPVADSSPKANRSHPPPLIYTRNELLTLYSSPLIPKKLNGMKELRDWYGEYHEGPPPSARTHSSSVEDGMGPTSTAANTNTTTPTISPSLSNRALRKTNGFTPGAHPFGSSSGGNGSSKGNELHSSNPFANFGRFGVDGGLEGAPIDAGRFNSGKGGHINSTSKHNASAQKDEGAGMGSSVSQPYQNDRFGGKGPAGDFRERSRTAEAVKSKEEGTALGPAVVSAAARKEGRAELEGGWRTAGADKRGVLRSHQSNPNDRERTAFQSRGGGTGGATDARGGIPESTGRFDRLGDGNVRRFGEKGGTDRERDKSEYATERDHRSTGSRSQPAWMDDHDASSPAAPSWMNTTNNAAEAKAKPEGAPKASVNPRNAWTGGATSSKGGGNQSEKGEMDSIQAWKMQMKEMERKQKEKDSPPSAQDNSDNLSTKPEQESQPKASSSLDQRVPSTASSTTTGSTVFSSIEAPRPSVFSTLGIGTSIEVPANPGLSGVGSSNNGSGGGGGGGKGSRFAKFFDGKAPTSGQPPSTDNQQQPQTQVSVFESLLSGNPNVKVVKGGPEPTQEDKDSMMRLLGMLQVSGARGVSPSNTLPGLKGSGAAYAPLPPPSSPPSASTKIRSPPQSPAAHSEQQSSSRGRQTSAGGSRFAFSSVNTTMVPATLPVGRMIQTPNVQTISSQGQGIKSPSGMSASMMLSPPLQPFEVHGQASHLSSPSTFPGSMHFSSPEQRQHRNQEHQDQQQHKIDPVSPLSPPPPRFMTNMTSPQQQQSYTKAFPGMHPGIMMPGGGPPLPPPSNSGARSNNGVGPLPPNIFTASMFGTDGPPPPPPPPSGSFRGPSFPLMFSGPPGASGSPLSPPHMMQGGVPDLMALLNGGGGGRGGLPVALQQQPQQQQPHQQQHQHQHQHQPHQQQQQQHLHQLHHPQESQHYMHH